MLEQRTEWIIPQEAARRMSKRVGYIVTPDDLKQMRKNKRIKRELSLSRQIKLYDAAEIAVIEPPKKRHPRPFIEWEQFLEEERDKRKTRLKNT